MERHMDEIKEKAHYIAITGIVRRTDGKYLLCKRSPKEKIFPNKWCVPGGKVQQSDFISQPKDTQDHWFDIFEKVLQREIFEETQLKIKNPGYVSNLALIRPNGFSTIIVSMYAEFDAGEVKLNESELTEYAWVNVQEAKQYDLIENIYEQMLKVEEKFSKNIINP